MKIFFFLSLKFLLRFIINGETFPRDTRHMCVGVHVCMCTCMYVQDMCVYTCVGACMHACVCVQGVSAMIPIRGFLCTNSVELPQKDFINLSLNATQPLNTKYKQGYYSCSHQSMPSSELFRFPMDIIHLKLCSLNALDVQFACLHTSTLKVSCSYMKLFH